MPEGFITKIHRNILGLIKNVSLKSRLDFCLISSSILHLFKDISHSFAPLSEHKKILINLVGLQPISKMWGYWKFNNALLKDTKFNDSITHLRIHYLLICITAMKKDGNTSNINLD